MNLNAIHNTYIQENYSGEHKCQVNTSVCLSIYRHTPGFEYTDYTCMSVPSQWWDILMFASEENSALSVLYAFDFPIRSD